ncbi:MAG TPA: response regulator, partial [Blastocatellia bacterium]
YEVTVAASAVEALKRAMCEKFDLYLLDVRLSDGTGIELCEQIRAFDSKTPVVVCSGDVRESVRNQALMVGVQYFLKKPVALDYLHKTVDSLVSRDTGMNDICA